MINKQHLTQLGMRAQVIFISLLPLCIASCERELLTPLFTDFLGRDRPFILKQRF